MFVKGSSYIFKVLQHLSSKIRSCVEHVRSYERLQLDGCVLELDERQTQPPLEPAQGAFQLVRRAH